jgi:hypothetical protein
MIFGLFRKKQLYILLFIPIVAVLLWLKTFLSLHLESLPDESFQMTFFRLVNEMLNKLDIPKLTRYISILLLVIQAFYVIKLNMKYGIIEEDKSTYLPAFVFIILSSSYFHLQRFHAIYIANLLLLFVLDIIFSSEKKRNAMSNYFNASLIIAISSLFYLNSIFYIILVWIGLIIFRSFKWREFIASLGGLVLPFIILQTYYYAIADLPEELLIDTQLNMVISMDFLRVFHNYYYVVYGYILLMILISSYYMIRVYKYKYIHSRKCYQLFLWQFILTAGLFTISSLWKMPSASLELIPVISVPVSFIISHYLLSISRKWVAELLFTIMLALVVSIQFI